MNNFETMPLRFRVWDDREGKFCAEALPDKMKIEFDIWEMGWWLDVDEQHRKCYIISQDTGLKDKNGKSVYTGDIVEKRYSNDESFNGVRGVCFYDSESAEVDFDLVHGSDNIKGFLEEYEVVGNIWENPELLEEK